MMLQRAVTLNYLFKVWERSRILRLLVMCIIAWLLAASAFYYFEGDEAFGSYADTLTGMLVLLLSGEFLETPQTHAGMAAAIAASLFSVIVVALLTAEIAAYFVESRLFQRRGERQVELSGHVIVCNRGPSLHAVLAELTSKLHSRDFGVVVICEDDPELLNERATWVKGDPTDDEVLAKAAIGSARAAMVLAADRNDPVASDSRNILTALAVESANPAVHTAVEIMDPANRKHLRHASVDEIICVGEVSTKLAVQTVINPGLSKLVGSLLSFDEGGEFYRVITPDGYTGLSFGEALGTYHQNHGAVLVAVERDGEYIMAPAPGVRLEGGDVAVVIARQFPDGLEAAG